MCDHALLSCEIFITQKMVMAIYIIFYNSHLPSMTKPMFGSAVKMGNEFVRWEMNLPQKQTHYKWEMNLSLSSKTEKIARCLVVEPKSQ